VGNESENASFLSKSCSQNMPKDSSITLVTDCDLSLMAPKNTDVIRLITRPLEVMGAIEDSFYVLKASNPIVHFMSQLSSQIPVLLHFIYQVQFASIQHETYLCEKNFSEVEKVMRFMIQSLGEDEESRISMREPKSSFKRQILCDLGILDRIFILMLEVPFSPVDFDFSHHLSHFRFMKRIQSDNHQRIRLSEITKYPNLKNILNLVYDCFVEFLKEENNQSQLYIARNFNIFIRQLSPDLKADELLDKIVSNNSLIVSCLKPTHIDLIVEYLTENILQSRISDFLCSICSGIMYNKKLTLPMLNSTFS
jgi:hypothetical protein